MAKQLVFPFYECSEHTRYDQNIEMFDDGWYFWDEVFVDRYGPFLTIEEAQASIIKYCREVLEGLPTPKPTWKG